MTEKWRTLVDERKAVCAVFIDFRKAFDSVSHTKFTVQSTSQWNHGKPVEMAHRLPF